MNLIKRIWDSIVQSDNYLLEHEIDVLKQENQTKDAQINFYKETNIRLSEDLEKSMLDSEDLNEQVLLIQDQLVSESEPEVTTHDTYFKKTAQSYVWKPGKKIRLHESLQEFSNNIDMIDKYNKWLTQLGVKNYENPDRIVYAVTLRVQKYINSLPDDYKTDIEAFGKSEYWLSPTEAYDYYVNKKKVADCEDVSSLLYGAIISKLIVNQFFSEIWRLKRVDIQITGSEAHALLAWKKNNNVWAAIESTYGEQYFKSNWNRDADIFKSIYARVLHIFDERGEYLLK